MRVVIMAGGTGGHVYPALALAKRFLHSGHSVSWIGTRAGLEAKVVPEHNIEIDWITITGLRRNGFAGWLLAPVRLLRAVSQAVKIMRFRKPKVVLGLGGFASGPGGLAAWLMRIPLVIHEQNAIAGLTNKILAKFAARVLEAFPGTFSPRFKAQAVGNPVRPEIAAVKQKSDSDNLNILVIGGSLGALAINQIIPESLAEFKNQALPTVWHQTGSGKFTAAKEDYQKYEIKIFTNVADLTQGGVYLAEYIDDMAAAYSWADVLICRAGAMTVFEVAACARPALFIPYPYAVDDHQTANASYLVKAGGAYLIQQAELDSKKT